ncbi:DHH family phosphoesterase [Thermanaerothrix sp.]|jgi:phosphoesterase RecJ-like protein|uniref:DHH family phosphoesterase n=1 Tax=Thermanaerothrix sp. TaxID=2972675 RepID=UPI002ADE4DAF|nr:DHH family phosphoesterase [Thermanaerothrix sp.]
MTPADLDATIRQMLHSAQRILITTHIRPDGDAIGSLLGLGLALQHAGATVQMVLPDGMPPVFRHLPGSDQIRREVQPPFDLFIVLDTADIPRISASMNGYQVDICIDHHVTNPGFARVNLIDPEAVATAAILAEHLPAWDLPINSEVASALLTGIITDTIGFRTSNMTPKALRLAADLMEQGANLPELYKRALIHRSFEAARFWGYGLVNLKRQGRLIWTTLTQADRIAAGYQGNDDADLTDILSGIEDGDIAVLFIQHGDGRIKVSWRAKPGWDVSTLAARFGGGGHPAAAGADFYGNLEEVQETVLKATQDLWEQQAMKSNSARG